MTFYDRDFLTFCVYVCVWNGLIGEPGKSAWSSPQGEK